MTVPTFTSPPKLSQLDRQIADAKARQQFAATDDLKRFYAERVVGLRFERGDFEMIANLDKDTRAALVRAQLKEPGP